MKLRGDLGVAVIALLVAASATTAQAEPTAAKKAPVAAKAVPAKAQAAIDAPPPPKPTDTTYVAIGPTDDKSGRRDKSVAGVVRAAMQAKLLSLAGHAVAPPKEPKVAAAALLQRTKMRGYLLETTVDRPEYAKGVLTMTLHVTIWSYPTRALEREVTLKAAKTDVPAKSAADEDELLRQLVDRAIEKFAAGRAGEK